MALPAAKVEKALKADIARFNEKYRCSITKELTFAPVYLILENSSGQKSLSPGVYDLFVTRDDGHWAKIIEEYTEQNLKPVGIRHKQLPSAIDLLIRAIHPKISFARFCKASDTDGKDDLTMDNLSQEVISWICQTDRKLFIWILKQYSTCLNEAELMRKDDISSDVRSFVSALSAGFVNYDEAYDRWFAACFIVWLQADFSNLKITEGLKIHTGQTFGELASAPTLHSRIKLALLDIFVSRKKDIGPPVVGSAPPTLSFLRRRVAAGGTPGVACAPRPPCVPPPCKCPRFGSAHVVPILALPPLVDPLDDSTAYKKLTGTTP